MNIPDQYVAFDFDGVLCDSIEECFRLSYHSFLAMYSGVHGEPASVAQLSEPPHRKEFMKRRWLVRPARNFYLLWKQLDRASNDGRHPDSFDSLNSLHLFESLELEFQSELSKFEKLFFSFRASLLKHDLKGWLELNAPFPGMKETVSSFRPENVFVITTKDNTSVENFLTHHQVRVRCVYGRGSFRHKSEVIQKLLQEHDIPPSKFFFVDDHPDHLTDCIQNSGCRCGFAAWGYTDVKEVSGAKTLQKLHDVNRWVNG